MTKFKKCIIERTATTTGGHDGKPLRNVYKVTGRFEHPAGPRPFLTSIRTAKEWINEQAEIDPKNRMKGD